MLQNILHRREAPDASAAAVFPVTVAAVDVGSNAIRCLAMRWNASDRASTLAQIRTPVRLGHGAFRTGRLEEGAMAAAVDALAGYRERLLEHGVDHYRAVATSAVRDSDNGEEFRARVRDQAGIELEIITGAEEARLVHVAVRSRISLGGARWILADLGGGSVEVSLVDDDGVHWSVSHGMGSVRLLEELAESGDEQAHFQRRLEEYAATLRIPPGLKRGAAGFIATGGNIEKLARLAGDEPASDGVDVLPLTALRGVIETLLGLSYRQRVDQLGLREDRADVILPAAMIYERIAILAGFDRIHVPHVGVKEGVVLDLLDEVAHNGPHAARHDRTVFMGALALGRRYRFDEAHARQVTRLALAIFDQLARLHGLGDADRRVLMAAAMLHDIGTFISFRRHHMHSLYIIAQSELPGFTTREILMVANVARYHRRGGPSPSHEAFAQLDADHQVRVRRLASLLRLADALDREHVQKVAAVSAVVRSDGVELAVEADGDLVLERWAFRRKADLFRATFRSVARLAGDDA